MDFIFELFAKIALKSILNFFVFEPIKQYGFALWLINALIFLSLVFALFFVYRYNNPRSAIKQKSRRKKR